MTRQGLCLDATQAPVNILDRLEGSEQGCPTGGHGTGTVGDRHVRATILQTVAPSDALDCIGHGLAHAPTDSPGLQACVRMRPNEKTPSAKQPLRGVLASGCRTRAAGFRTRGSSAGDAGNAGGLLQGVPLDGHRRHSNGMCRTRRPMRSVSVAVAVAVVTQPFLRSAS